MMDRLLVQFKGCISWACQKTRGIANVSHGQLIRDRSLDEIEAAIFAERREPREIAALALDQLCERDGTFVDGVVCMAIDRFLELTAKNPPSEDSREERLRELHALLQEQGTYHDIEVWIRKWHPLG